MTLYRIIAGTVCVTFLFICLAAGVYAAWRVIAGEGSAREGCAPGIECDSN